MNQTPSDVRLSQEAFDTIINSYARAQAASNDAVLRAVRTAGDVFGRIQSPSYNHGGKPGGRTHRQRKAKAKERSADPATKYRGKPKSYGPGSLHGAKPRSDATVAAPDSASIKQFEPLIPVPTIGSLLQQEHGDYGLSTQHEVQAAIDDLLTEIPNPAGRSAETTHVSTEVAPPAPAYTPAPPTTPISPANTVPTTHITTLPAPNSATSTWEELDYEMDEPLTVAVTQSKVAKVTQGVQAKPSYLPGPARPRHQDIPATQPKQKDQIRRDGGSAPMSGKPDVRKNCQRKFGAIAPDLPLQGTRHVQGVVEQARLGQLLEHQTLFPFRTEYIFETGVFGPRRLGAFGFLSDGFLHQVIFARLRVKKRLVKVGS
ncbi:hypothetical protein BDV93DRAFT_516433 [Ceratobasidium sp. AG-I]|nr:hypothetical protein BDV93DRAFT_516433 [Ceratobasidium sp. AG-I]